MSSGLELDTGRYAPSGPVTHMDIPGLMDPGFYRSDTNSAPSLLELIEVDPGRYSSVPHVPLAPAEGMELAAFPGAGPVEAGWLEEVASSGFYDPTATAPAGPPGPLEGLETTSLQPTGGPGGLARGRRLSTELARIVCRCSETHRAPRCPSCGSPHPDATDKR